ncbi:MAG: PilZ domain-containing protein [Oscillospiraceae bacterium]|jgi:hypothetical protein|nr:PilZ domain-containing protein [Oscillospiraceae bacterium]
MNYADITRADLLDPNNLSLYLAEKGYYFVLADESKESDTDRVVFNAPLFASKANLLPPQVVGAEANLLFYFDPEDEEDDEDEVGIPYKGIVEVSTPRKIIINALEEKEIVVDKRRFYKIKVHEKGVITGLTTDTELDNFENPIKCVVSDINLGGVFLEVDEGDRVFNKDDVLVVELEFLGTKENVSSKIMRIKNLDNATGYGCSFLIPAGSDFEAFVQKYVNDNQVSQRLISKEQEDREKAEAEEHAKAQAAAKVVKM